MGHALLDSLGAPARRVQFQWHPESPTTFEEAGGNGEDFHGDLEISKTPVARSEHTAGPPFRHKSCGRLSSSGFFCYGSI